MNGVKVPRVPDSGSIAGLTVALAAIAVSLAVQVYRGGIKSLRKRRST